jgi:hypothetical protein
LGCGCLLVLGVLLELGLRQLCGFSFGIFFRGVSANNYVGLFFGVVGNAGCN